MSYCVNCGVELDDSAKKCALCATPVINPSKTIQTTEKPFSETEHIPPHLNRRFIAYIFSMIFLIPNIVCFLTNAVFVSHGFWALYVNATSFLVWAIFVFPFLTKKLRPYLMWFFDTIVCCLYVYFFFAMGYEQKTAGWFYSCALPIILTASLLILVFMLWSKKKKRSWVLKSIAVISDTAIASLVAGSVIEFAANVDYAFDIGMITFVSCVVLAAFLVYCYSSKHMRSWLEKRFFI